MSDHTYRPYDPERDADAAVRILSLAFGGCVSLLAFVVLSAGISAGVLLD